MATAGFILIGIGAAHREVIQALMRWSGRLRAAGRYRPLPRRRPRHRKPATRKKVAPWAT